MKEFLIIVGFLGFCLALVYYWEKKAEREKSKHPSPARGGGRMRNPK